jgi:hypothetical protein
MTVTMALPLMTLGQTAEPQQAQGQTNETQEATPSKGKKAHAAQKPGKWQAKPETGTERRGQTNVQSRAPEVKKTEAESRSSKSQTTTVKKEEFKSRHREVFTLGRHPKEFFVQRFGANHVRLIGNTYFAFVDGCWVAVDVAGFVFTERVICAGDPDFIIVY